MPGIYDVHEQRHERALGEGVLSQLAVPIGFQIAGAAMRRFGYRQMTSTSRGFLADLFSRSTTTEKAAMEHLSGVYSEGYARGAGRAGRHAVESATRASRGVAALGTELTRVPVLPGLAPRSMVGYARGTNAIAHIPSASLGRRIRPGTGSGFFSAGVTARSVARGFFAYQSLMLLPELGEMVAGAYMDWRPRATPSRPQHDFATVFYDPRGAATQRQRAIAAIHESQLSTRAALGNESSFLHQ